MPESDLDEAIAAARTEVVAWMKGKTKESFASDTELTAAMCDRARQQFGLNLRINWNPSACVFEGRWENNGRAAEGFQKPFEAESFEEARLLSCAGLSRLLKSLG